VQHRPKKQAFQAFSASSPTIIAIAKHVPVYSSTFAIGCCMHHAACGAGLAADGEAEAGGGKGRRSRAGHRKFLAPGEEGEDAEDGEDESEHPDDRIEGIEVLLPCLCAAAVAAAVLERQAVTCVQLTYVVHVIDQFAVL
jgi:hypothetical protein